jgi:hypothetical protein
LVNIQVARQSSKRSAAKMAALHLMGSTPVKNDQQIFSPLIESEIWGNNQRSKSESWCSHAIIG